ncbi:MAG: transposase [Candidatus Saccharimonas sp.]
MRVDPQCIIAVLIDNDGNVKRTAREVGVSPATVRFWRRRARSGTGDIRYLRDALSRGTLRVHTD